MRLKLAYESMAHRKCIAPSAHYAHHMPVARWRWGSFLFVFAVWLSSADFSEQWYETEMAVVVMEVRLFGGKMMWCRFCPAALLSAKKLTGGAV